MSSGALRGDRGNPLVRSILTIASGSVLGSAVAFLVSPALTRLFTPEEFGAFSVASAIVVTLLPLVTGRLELAVPLPREENDARALLVLGGSVAAVGCTLLLAVSLLTRGLAEAVTPDAVSDLLVALPVLLVPMAGFQLLNAWAIRQSRYSAIATRNVLQACVTAAAQLIAGLIGYGALGLLGGYFLGQTVGLLALLVGSSVRGHVDQPRVRSVATTFRRHPLILAPAGFINGLGAQAPLLVVAATYGATGAGLFALALRVMAVPVALLGQSTAQVYVSELARSHREGDSELLLPHFWRTTKLLSLIGVALVLVGAPVSYLTFGAVFGGEWAEAGTIAALLTVGTAAQLVGSSVSQTLVVFEKLWTLAIWDCVRLAITVGTVVLGWSLGWSLASSAALLSAVTVLLYVAYWRMSFAALRDHVAVSVRT